MAVRSRRRGGRICGLGALVVALVSSACAPSGFRYVTNAATNTYFKVPRGWARFDARQLADAEDAALTARGRPVPSAVDRAFERSIQWRVAFDADAKPSLDHVVGFGAQPVVEVRVRRLLDDERDQVNLRALRNLVFQYDQLKQQAGQAGGGDFRSLREQELQLGGGLHGERLTFEIRAQDSQVYAVDQTALVDGSTTRVYLLLIQAGEQQYFANRKLLDEIATSFTIKRKG